MWRLHPRCPARVAPVPALPSDLGGCWNLLSGDSFEGFVRPRGGGEAAGRRARLGSGLSARVRARTATCPPFFPRAPVLASPRTPRVCPPARPSPSASPSSPGLSVFPVRPSLSLRPSVHVLFVSTRPRLLSHRGPLREHQPPRGGTRGHQGVPLGDGRPSPRGRPSRGAPRSRPQDSPRAGTPQGSPRPAASAPRELVPAAARDTSAPPRADAGARQVREPRWKSLLLWFLLLPART